MPSTLPKSVAGICLGLTLAAALLANKTFAAEGPVDTKQRFLDPINVNPPPSPRDQTVKYDYDIVYVRAPRQGRQGPHALDRDRPSRPDRTGADLMLLHPDGKEELLVAGGEDGSITDPFVSLDGEWVYYVHLQRSEGDQPARPAAHQGADILQDPRQIAGRVVRLTIAGLHARTPGPADWSRDCRKAEPGKNCLTYGVLNMGPCPLPGGKLVFVSNRNGFRPPKHPSPLPCSSS